MSEQAARLMLLFAGLERAHGEFYPGGTRPGTEKIEKKRAETPKTPATVDHWNRHLAGEFILGIIPIRDDNTCVWGVIDIDVYGQLDHQKMAKQLKDTPLVVCRSKSGGMHIFCFTSEPVTAKQMRDKLAEVASGLGYSGCEVFPKQTELRDQTDVGNWLNMPYYNDAVTTLQFGWTEDGPLKLDPFLDFAESKKTTSKGLEAIQVVNDKIGEEAFADGPPCLQALARDKIGEGHRNDGVYDIGVYLKLAFPSNWKGMLFEYNNRFVSPPLPNAEVDLLTKSLDKKTYNYKCQQEPIKSYCNKTKCVKCKFGVKAGTMSARDEAEVNMPDITGLLQCGMEHFYVSVNDRRVGPLKVEQITGQYSFKNACFPYNVVIPTVSPQRWDKQLIRLMKEKQEDLQPTNVTERGNFEDALHRYLQRSPYCDSLEEVAYSAKPYAGEEKGLTYFTIGGFLAYRGREQRERWTDSYVATWLGQLGYKWEDLVIHGHTYAIYTCRSIQTKSGPLKTPDIQDPI